MRMSLMSKSDADGRLQQQQLLLLLLRQVADAGGSMASDHAF
jgi:hypothetical protein